MSNIRMYKIKIITTLLICTSLSVLSSAVLAQYNGSFEGLYSSAEGQELSANLTRKSGDNYSISLSTTVPYQGNQPGCGGSIEGEVKLTGKKAIMEIENEGFIKTEAESLQNRRLCKIELNFKDEYTLELKEIEGCSYYHGASCNFSGTVVHDAAGI